MKYSSTTRLLLAVLLLAVCLLEPAAAVRTLASFPGQDTASPPTIRDVSDNSQVYAGGKVPRYGKLEITFQVDALASNPQMPYDPAPPPGIPAGSGISVDALFTPDGWQTVYRQPAFYYQEFLDEVKGGREWFYPTGRYVWKVRFSPHQTGAWQYRLVARDAGGYRETGVYAFEVAPSSHKGFVRVSPKDGRYFEFENGDYFPGLSYNLNWDELSWTNPVLDNRGEMEALNRSGIQLVRIWLSQWGIYGSAWNPWNSPDPGWHGQPVPWPGLTFETAYPGSDVSLLLDAGENPCMFIGFMKAAPAVRRNTWYRVRIRYLAEGLGGPVDASQPSGFVAKTGGWLWGEGAECSRAGMGEVVTGYQSQDSGGWQMLEGRLNSGESDFLANFYLVLENVAEGKVYVDRVWIEEELGDGAYGANIVSKPWMGQHWYFEQRNSYAFDKVVELAGQYGVYLRPVILEKNDYLFNHLDDQGQPIPADERCDDQDQGNDPERCPGNRWFYGNGRSLTKVRWLHQAWWRYLQARWGYSPNIHSWELLNEGDPQAEGHYVLADELGRYMRQFQPNHHLVSTSFWHSFPRDEFWTNPEYAHVDFADVHRYISPDDPGFEDTALATYLTSMQVGAPRTNTIRKPVIRGEIGLIDPQGQPADLIQADTQGIWLHNFIWGGINPGGLIESYWYVDSHISGEDDFDHRSHYRSYYNFIRDIPLNNGHYRNAGARISNPRLRAWGQKDPVNGSAHLWIQNKGHTWENVVEGIPIEPVSGTIALPGFLPGQEYRLEWWDTYQTSRRQQKIETHSIAARPDGILLLQVENLVTDVAVKIFLDYEKTGRQQR